MEGFYNGQRVFFPKTDRHGAVDSFVLEFERVQSSEVDVVCYIREPTEEDVIDASLKQNNRDENKY